MATAVAKDAAETSAAGATLDTITVFGTRSEHAAGDRFAIGSGSSAGRDFVDPPWIERVEILRGSASALHGSDALLIAPP